MSSQRAHRTKQKAERAVIKLMVLAPALSLPAQESPPAADLDRVVFLLSVVDGYIKHNTDDSTFGLILLRSGPKQVALLTLLSASIRRCSGGDESHFLSEEQRACYEEIFTTSLTLLCYSTGLAHKRKPALYFTTVGALLRMDTLQAHARLLTQRTASLVTAGGQHEENALKGTLRMAHVMMLNFFTRIDGPSSLTPGSAEYVLVDAIFEALAESALLEHMARAQLHLVMRGVDLDSDESRLFMHWLHYLSCGASRGAPEDRRRHFKVVLSGGACVQYLAAAYLLAGLFAADQGPRYGVPAALLRGLRMPEDHPPGGVRAMSREWRRYFWLVDVGRSVPSRLRPAALCTLLQRCASAATAALRQAPHAELPGQPAQPCTAAMNYTCHLALRALNTCALLLSGPLARQPQQTAGDAGAEAVTARQRRRWQEWWRCMMELGSNLPDSASAKVFASVILPPHSVIHRGRLPVSAPVAFSAAASAGLHPWMERTLRRAALLGEARTSPGLGEDQARACGLALCWALEQNGGNIFLANLLAYGEPRQAAALVAGLGGLLRSLVAQAEAGSAAEAGVKAHHLKTLLISLTCTSHRFFSLLLGWLQRSVWDLSGLQPGAQPEEPTGQLLTLLSYALASWLPPLAAAALELGPNVGLAAYVAVHAFLSFLPCLFADCTLSGPVEAEERAAGPGGSSSASGAAAADAPGAPRPAPAWGPWLLREARVVEVVGAALQRREQLRAGCGNNQYFDSALAVCCKLVATAYPDQVLAHAERATSSSSAPAGSWSPGSLRALAGALAGSPLAPRVAALAEGLEARAGAADSGGCGSEQGGGAAWGYEAGNAGVAAEAAHVAGGPGEAHGSLPEWYALMAESQGLTEATCHAACLAACRLLPPPDQLPALLPPPPPACANPRCASLDGDGEAGGRLQTCKGCGAVQYCRRECQVAHWRAGHKGACGRRAG